MTIDFSTEATVQQFSDLIPSPAPPAPPSVSGPWGTARRYALRLLLALAASLGTLKLADVAFGRLADTRQRHRLRLAPNVQIRHKSREFDYVFRTNSHGLRGADVPFEKPPHTFRIVVLGDSFVAGYGVSDDSLMTNILDEKIEAAHRSGAADSTSGHAKVEVINVGRVGTSSIREFDIYETLGRRFQPDLVVLAYYLGNDLAEVVQEQTDVELAGWHPEGSVRRGAFFAFPNLYLELAMIRQSRQQSREFAQRDETEIVDDIGREARARGRDPAAAVTRYHSLSRELRDDVASGMLAEQRIIDSCIEPDRLVRALDPNDEDYRVAWGRTQDHLNRLHDAVMRDGAKLVVVAIPAPFQLDRKSLEFHTALGYEVRKSWLVDADGTNSSARQPQTRHPRTGVALAEWARLQQVPFLDLTNPLAARFHARGEPLYFIEDVHWNREGNVAAAEAVCEFLRSRKLCP